MNEQGQEKLLDVPTAILIVVGLTLFEIVSSIDNAVINADVLSSVSKKARRWFLTWGVLVAVFVVRGGLPLLIVYSLNPQLGLLGTATAAVSADPAVANAIHQSAPPLLIAGGTFLLFLFFHWLFLETKSFGLKGEEFLQRKGAWFYAVVSIILTVLVWFSIRVSPILAFGATAGSTLFFVVHGFRQNAEKVEQSLVAGPTSPATANGMSDISKVLYLEVIDASFSIDGVLGAFAYTFSIALILIGNGIGAVVIRQLTVRSTASIKRYIYLKNGAMYSILFLGAIMLADSFGFEIPQWASPTATILILSYFFLRSRREISIRGR